MILAALLWHVLTVADLARAGPGARVQTHVEVAGWVTYVRREDDGDLHIRVCDSPQVEVMDRKHCVVAECIPALPCEAPMIGHRYILRGISRYDSENGHKWREIHPVLSIREGGP
jgi:hypothetical protein